jgi:hypothetical protein
MGYAALQPYVVTRGCGGGKEDFGPVAVSDKDGPEELAGWVGDAVVPGTAQPGRPTQL